MPGPIDIVRAARLVQALWPAVAAQLSRHSHGDNPILPRSAAYFLGTIREDRVMIAVGGGAMVGAVCLHRLAPGIDEVGSAWVAPDYRGQGIYSLLKDAALARGAELRARVISTSRLTSSRLTPGLASSLSRGMLPMPFAHLAATAPEAYRQCCNCDAQRNHRSCPERDRTCILTAQAAHACDVERALAFVSSAAWTAVPLAPGDTLLVRQYIGQWQEKLDAAPASCCAGKKVNYLA